MLLDVGHISFAVGRPPSRNCQLDPTTKLIISRREVGEARRAPPPTLSLINSLKPAGVLK